MPRLSLAAFVLVVMALSVAHAQDTASLTVFSAMKQADRSLDEMKIWRRVPVSGELDLVLVLGTPPSLPFDMEFDGAGSGWWKTERKLGLFVQERGDRHRVFSLAIASGPGECFAELRRATATDTVIGCQGEKSDVHPHQKFVYDIRAKRLVSRSSYQPARIVRASSNGAVATMIAQTEAQDLVIDFVAGRVPEFRVTQRPRENSPGESVTAFRGMDRPEPGSSARFGPSGAFTLEISHSQDPFTDQSVVREGSRVYPLPRSTYEMFAKARPRRVEDGNGPDTIFAEQMGPWAIDGERLWFGKTFYDSEGFSGIGGLGYFDAGDRQFHIFTSPLVAEGAVSALSVGRDAVWASLVSNGEWGNSGEGLVRFDRATETFQRVDIGSGIGYQFLSAGDRLILTTDIGLAVLHQNDVKPYIIDRTTDGRWRVVAAEPF